MLRQIKRFAMIAETNPLSPVSESYRMLRTNLQFLMEEQSLQVISISSAYPGEGKTTTIINLAITFANEGKRVVLIDADMRRSTLHHMLSIPNDVGLSTVLSKRCTCKDAIRSSMIPNLDVIPAGPLTYHPSELLQSDEMLILLSHLKSQYDLVFIDVPPVLVVADAKIAASRADGVIMVIRSGKTKRDTALKTKAYLEKAGVNVIGFVLNDHKQRVKHSYYDYYQSPGRRLK